MSDGVGPIQALYPAIWIQNLALPLIPTTLEQRSEIPDQVRDDLIDVVVIEQHKRYRHSELDSESPDTLEFPAVDTDQLGKNEAGSSDMHSKAGALERIKFNR